MTSHLSPRCVIKRNLVQFLGVSNLRFKFRFANGNVEESGITLDSTVEGVAERPTLKENSLKLLKFSQGKEICAVYALYTCGTNGVELVYCRSKQA